MTNAPSPKWCRTKSIYPNTVLWDDDWSLLDATGDRIAQLFNTGGDDLIGAWRWRVWLDYMISEGSARNEAEARQPWLKTEMAYAARKYVSKLYNEFARAFESVSVSKVFYQPKRIF